MQWDLQCHSLACKKVKPPEKYPVNCHPDSPPVPEDRPMNPTHFVFVKQTYKFLHQAVQLAEFNIRKKTWNKGTTEAYLRSCGVSRSVIENVWRYGRNIAFDAEAAMLAREIYKFDDGELDNGWVPTESDMYPKI